MEEDLPEDPSTPFSCLADANVGSLQCGPAAQATCTGNGDGVGSKCCSAGGYCGSGDAYCGEGMQEEYSNGKNLCPEVAPAQGEQELPEAKDYDDRVCPKPVTWCAHAGATNEPKECGGLLGHFCSDVYGKS